MFLNRILIALDFLEFFAQDYPDQRISVENKPISRENVCC